MTDEVVFQVVLNIPAHLLGKILAGLPRGINPQINRMMPRESGSGRPKRGQAGQPRGAVQPKVLELIRKEPLKLVDVRQQIKGHNSKTITSAFYQLVRKGLIKKNGDGNYEATQ